jgi:peptidoglycan hydrolase-like protein with peptidoglycan-binding domain
MPDRVLKLHDKGPDVTEAQELLNRTGAILDPDADFGRGTETAVREFQTALALPATGSIDAKTWEALRLQTEPCPDLPRIPAKKCAISAMPSRSAASQKSRPRYDS